MPPTNRSVAIPCDECQHVADQKEVEEVEEIGKVSSTDKLPLICREFSLSLQQSNMFYSLFDQAAPEWPIIIGGLWGIIQGFEAGLSRKFMTSKGLGSAFVGEHGSLIVPIRANFALAQPTTPMLLRNLKRKHNRR